jgi:hypothetical protein
MDATLNRLIDLAVDGDDPILIRNRHGEGVGLVYKRNLFRAIQGDGR